MPIPWRRMNITLTGIQEHLIASWTSIGKNYQQTFKINKNRYDIDSDSNNRINF